MEAEVLEEQHLPLLHLRHQLAHAVAHAVVGEDDVLSQELAEPGAGRLEGQRRNALAVGPTQVRGEDDLGAAPHRMHDGGQRRANAGVVLYIAVLVERDVEVDAHEEPLALDGQLFDRADHSLPATISATSTMRLEKPHSLSYQAKTFTNLPSSPTMVCVESKIEEAGLPL